MRGPIVDLLVCLGVLGIYCCSVVYNCTILLLLSQMLDVYLASITLICIKDIPEMYSCLKSCRSNENISLSLSKENYCCLFVLDLQLPTDQLGACFIFFHFGFSLFWEFLSFNSEAWLYQQFNVDSLTNVPAQQYACGYIMHMIHTTLSPDYLTNKAHLRLFHLLEDFDACGAISWSSAVLAYLYKVSTMQTSQFTVPWFSNTSGVKCNIFVYVSIILMTYMKLIQNVLTLFNQLWS